MKYTLIAWTILLVSCGTKTHDTAIDKDIDSVKASLDGEDFHDFFARFKEDSLFQIERVKFPMTIKSWDIDEDKPSTDKIEIGSWRHLKFEYKDEYAKREIDAYTQETKMFADSAKLELRGVDNGILIDFEFTKLNGQWFLVSEKDYSN